MTRVAALAVFLVGIGGAIGHTAIGLGTTARAQPYHQESSIRIQPYHQESSIRVVHANGGFRIVSPTQRHS